MFYKMSPKPRNYDARRVDQAESSKSEGDNTLFFLRSINRHDEMILKEIWTPILTQASGSPGTISE